VESDPPKPLPNISQDGRYSGRRVTGSKRPDHPVNRVSETLSADSQKPSQTTPKPLWPGPIQRSTDRRRWTRTDRPAWRTAAADHTL